MIRFDQCCGTSGLNQQPFTLLPRGMFRPEKGGCNRVHDPLRPELLGLPSPTSPEGQPGPGGGQRGASAWDHVGSANTCARFRWLIAIRCLCPQEGQERSTICRSDDTLPPGKTQVRREFVAHEDEEWAYDRKTLTWFGVDVMTELRSSRYNFSQ